MIGEVEQGRFRKCIILMLQYGMGWDEAKASLWFATPNPLLGGVSAEQLSAEGRSWKVFRFLITAFSENPHPAPGFPEKTPKPKKRRRTENNY